MKSCSAPCTKTVSEAEYGDAVLKATALLKGKTAELLAHFKEEMAEASKIRSTRRRPYRNQIVAVGRLAERQNVERPDKTDQDIISTRFRVLSVYLLVFSVEKGLLIDKQEYSFESREGFFDEFLVLVLCRPHPACRLDPAP